MDHRIYWIELPGETVRMIVPVVSDYGRFHRPYDASKGYPVNMIYDPGPPPEQLFDEQELGDEKHPS